MSRSARFLLVDLYLVVTLLEPAQVQGDVAYWLEAATFDCAS
ncbi:MAG: hypothetical protein ACK2UU_14955 [Anaerolineae bacterium]|jgi:hypothetical protein